MSLTSTSEPGSANSPAESRRFRLERLLEIASHDYDLGFEFGPRDRLKKSHIVLQAEPHIAENSSFTYLKGRALHLFGHYLSNDQAVNEAALHQETHGKPFFHRLWHALEDARLENQMIKRWPGTGKSFEATQLPNLGGALLRMMKPVDQLTYGIYFEGRGYQRAMYSGKVEHVLETARVQIQRAAKSETASDSLKVMLAMYPQLVHLLPLTQGKRKLEDDERPSWEETEGGEDLQGEVGWDDDGSTPGVPEIDIQDGLVSVNVAGTRREYPEWYRPGSLPWFERDIGEKQIHPSVMQSGSQTIIVPPKGDLAEFRVMYAEIFQEVGYLSQRLTSMIREKVYLRYGGYYRSGKLHMGKLWKQRIGDYDLFQRKITGDDRAVAFTLLVDESASMKGQEKSVIARKAAVLLGETFERLGLSLEIIGFSTSDFEAKAALKLGLTPVHLYRTMRCTQLEHRIYKRFDEAFHAVRTRLTGIQPRHNNWDEEHLTFAAQRILARPERKKIIMVICDGQPNGDANHLIRTIERVESLGVKTVGIGIGAEFVRDIYPQAVVVSGFHQMSQELLQILGREFKLESINNRY